MVKESGLAVNLGHCREVANMRDGEMPYDVNSKMAAAYRHGRRTMIPLKDDTPRLSTPLVNYFLIAANVAVFLFQSSLDRRAQSAFIQYVWPGSGAAGCDSAGSCAACPCPWACAVSGVCAAADSDQHVSACEAGGT